MDMREKLVKSEEIFNGKVIRLKKEVVLLPNGEEAGREIVNHPGGVAILPLDNENNVYMVRQYRRPFDDILLEIPAGKLNYGEDPFACGTRELEEETGLVAEKYDYLGKFYVTPGFCSEVIHLYLARGLKKGEAHLDEDEFLEVYKMPFDELFSMVMNNEIKDAKTAIAILKTKALLSL